MIVAMLYSNENFPRPVVEELRRLGHDVLTVLEAGQADQAISDEDVLAFAVSLGRAILTLNRKHFIRLHNEQPNHAGIVVCTFDPVSLAKQRGFTPRCNRYHNQRGSSCEYTDRLATPKTVPRRHDW